MLKIVETSLERDRESPNSRTRIYVSVKDESILENLINRRSRPKNLYREVLADFFTKHATDLHLRLEDVPAIVKASTWSQKAGCNCGCSPGFVINRGWSYGKVGWITVAGDEAKREDSPQAEEIAAGRAAQILADPTLRPLI